MIAKMWLVFAKLRKVLVALLHDIYQLIIIFAQTVAQGRAFDGCYLSLLQSSSLLNSAPDSSALHPARSPPRSLLQPVFALLALAARPLLCSLLQPVFALPALAARPLLCPLL